MSLIDLICLEMMTDDVDTHKQSEKLQTLYEYADSQEKQLINEIMICLCGWTLHTLIAKQKGGNNE